MFTPDQLCLQIRILMSFQETLVSKKQKKAKKYSKCTKPKKQKKKTKKNTQNAKINFQKKTKIAAFRIFIAITTTKRD
jgi:hypothetical protein